MSRKKAEINPLRAERLKALLSEEKLKQTDFADKVHYSQQHISGIINKKIALTEETAANISSVFPKYSVEWLLGYSDYKNSIDAFIQSIQQMNEEGDLLNKAFYSLAALSGYNIKRLGMKTKTVEEALSSLHDYVEIEHDGKTISLSAEQLNALENIIYEHAEITIRRFLETFGKEVR